MLVVIIGLHHFLIFHIFFADFAFPHATSFQAPFLLCSVESFVRDCNQPFLPVGFEQASQQSLAHGLHSLFLLLVPISASLPLHSLSGTAATAAGLVHFWGPQSSSDGLLFY